jgi:hypothetical protein
VAAHLLDLDPRRLVERKAADPGSEGDQGERAGAELVRLRQRARRGGADRLRGGRAARLHGRRVDHPPGRHLAGTRLDRLAEPDRRPLGALALDRRPAGPRDRPGDAAAVAQLGVGGVGDRFHLELRDVRLADLDLGHAQPLRHS